MAIKIFFCYAHEDETLLNKLRAHLKPLQRLGLIETWYDRDINAGMEWESEISEHINTAQIILLLISSDFMDSDYCYSIEMKRAIERHERKEARVIPIILRHVLWQKTPLGKLQALPVDAKPITDPEWLNLDRALYTVAVGISIIIEELCDPTPINPTMDKEIQELLPSVPLTEMSIQTSESDLSTMNQYQIDAYCMKCKKKTQIEDAYEVPMKNGRIAVQGPCTVCGTSLFRIGRLKDLMKNATDT